MKVFLPSVLSYLKQHRYWVFLSLVFVFGFVLRFAYYPSFPSVSETADERAWTWLGASLIKEKQPTAWSLFDVYPKNQAIYKKLKNHAPLVRPFLDHPPLFAFIPGSMHLVQAENWEDFPSQKAIRLPMIFIGAFNILLLGWLLKLYFPNKKDEPINLLTTLAFASLPLIVFSSRMALADNLLATFSLLVLIFVRKRWFFLLWLVVFLAVLTKMQGVFTGGGLALYFWLIKEKKLVGLSFLSTLSGLLVFFLYGTYFNQKLFLSIFFNQSSRSVGFTTLLHRFIFHPTLVSHLWPTFIKVGLFLAGVLTVFKARLKKKDAYLPAASLFLSFLAVTFLFVDEININGWYEYAVFPLLFIGTREIIRLLKEETTPLKNLLFWFLVVLPNFRLAAAAFLNTSKINSHTVWFLTLFGFLGFLLPKNKKFTRTFFYFSFFVFVGLSIVTVFFLNQGSYSDLTWHLLNY